MIDDNRFKSEYDFNGKLSDLIQVTKACEKAGFSARDLINFLKRQNLKDVLKEINLNTFRKKEDGTQKLEAQRERAQAFGIGE